MFEEREKLLVMIEVLTGTRFHAMILLLGRLRYDINLNWLLMLNEWLILFVRKIKDLHFMLSYNSLFISRLYEVYIIDRSYSLFYGLSGVTLRSGCF